jgi:hypothetical protein
MLTIFSSWISIIGYEAHTFMMFSQIRHKPTHYILAFFHIHHRWINPLWHSIKFIMDEEPIVQSAWTHLLYFAYGAWIYHVGPTCQICTKKLFFDYQNIILCHFGGPHDTLVSDWPTCQLSLEWIFLDETKNGAKIDFEPWPHGHRKPLPLGYYFGFVVVRVIISLYYVLGC